MSRHRRVDTPALPSYMCEQDKASFDNMLTGTTIGSWYLLLAETLYEWNGLPEGANARYLERTLVTHGRAAFFDVPNVGWTNLEASPSGRYNIHGEPLALNLRGYNGKTWSNIPIGRCILVRNNAEMIPTLPTIIQYTQRMAQIQRAMDLNLNTMRTPFIFKCDEKQAVSIRAFYNNYQNNEPLITVNNGMDNPLEKLDLPSPFYLDKLANYKRQLQSELLTYLGVDNINFEKAAQMVDREVSANRELIERFLECGLAYRVKAAEQLSEAIDSKVTVRPRQFQKVTVTATDEVGSVREYNVYAEVDRSGKIYNDVTNADPEL